jgi:hypothetical protein
MVAFVVVVVVLFWSGGIGVFCQRSTLCQYEGMVGGGGENSEVWCGVVWWVQELLWMDNRCVFSHLWNAQLCDKKSMMIEQTRVGEPKIMSQSVTQPR